MKHAINGVFSNSTKGPLLFAAFLSIALATYAGSVRAGGLFCRNSRRPAWVWPAPGLKRSAGTHRLPGIILPG